MKILLASAIGFLLCSCAWSLPALTGLGALFPASTGGIHVDVNAFNTYNCSCKGGCAK